MPNAVCFGVFVLSALAISNPQSVNGDDLQFDFAYTSSRIAGQPGIFLHTSDGERLVSGTFTCAEAPSWSPDGKQITFQAKVDDRWDIYVLHVDGGKSRYLTNDPALDFHPVWSPDGSTIAFYSDRSPAGIWLIESDGTSLREFPIEIPNVGDFEWSPDGREVVFCANERIMVPNPPGPEYDYFLKTDVYIASRDGKNLRRITNAGSGANFPAWSPNGKQIAFSLSTMARGLSETNIHVVNVDGTGFRKLTNDAGQNLCPKWLPDGNGVLFYNQPSSDDTSPPRVIWVSTDGVRKTVVNVGESGGYFPDVRRKATGAAK